MLLGVLKPENGFYPISKSALNFYKLGRLLKATFSNWFKEREQKNQIAALQEVFSCF